jgi:signal transduction histidine kinase/CheY-like chemotaxis protein
MGGPAREALNQLWHETFGDALLEGARGELDRALAAGQPMPSIARLVERLPRLLSGMETRELGLERVKTDFLANVSHELRTPLQGVLGMIEMLRRANSLAPRQRVHVETLETAAQALMAVVNDLLDWTQTEQGRLELAPALCDLRETMTAVVGQFVSPARDKKTQLTLSIAPDVNTALLIDPARLRQVVSTLIVNALKSTSAGRIDVEVSSPDSPDAERSIEISVRDTGLGLEPEVLASVLEPFAQPPTNSIRRFGGTGLGLALAARIVERMGGLLWVDSTPGVGTMACLRVPVNLHVVEAEPSIIDAAPAAPIRRVLVAEDNPINQLVATAMLEQLGCRCTIAQTGREAIERWYSDSYDLLLMDLQMPEMDGIDATREIRRLEASGRPGASGRRARIIAMSAHALDSAHDEALAAGMDGYVDKPVQIIALEQLITPRSA